MNAYKNSKIVRKKLFEGIPCDLQNDLYALFDIFSESLRVIENEEIRKEYMDYCFLKVATITQKIILACKPYQPFNEKSLEDYIK